jgi:hypothetical protein
MKALARYGADLSRLDAAGGDTELIALPKDCQACERKERHPDGSAVAEQITAYLAGCGSRSAGPSW